MSAKPTLASVAVVAATLAIAACGDSSSTTSTASTSSASSEQAQKAVCAARSDIRRQIDDLKGLELSASSVGQVTQGLQAISEDLNKIKDARAGLSGDRRQQVDTAVKDFEGEVDDITNNTVDNLDLGKARSQLSSAVQQLATSFRQTFAKIDCG